MRRFEPLLDKASFLLVAGYLTVGLCWLVLCGRFDPNVNFRKLLWAAVWRVRSSGPLTQFQPEIGHCYRSPVDPRLVSDFEGVSRMAVYEDGVPLRGHAIHDTIRNDGRGCFSHWGPVVLLAASDNSDPRTNGRTYTFAEQ
jgi:hypothetical protein